jgi:hypothetical protein
MRPPPKLDDLDVKAFSAALYARFREAGDAICVYLEG